MIVAQQLRGTEPVSAWLLVPFFAVGALCVRLGLTFVRGDFRGLSSQIVARARDQVAQRVNKIVGWIFFVGGVVFLYGATTVTFELITGWRRADHRLTSSRSPVDEVPYDVRAPQRQAAGAGFTTSHRIRPAAGCRNPLASGS